MNPKAEIFFDAITLLGEDLVEEAQDYRFRKKRTVWKKLGSLAACLMLIASISLLALPRGCGGSAPKMNNSSAPSSTDSSAPAETPDQNAPALSGEPTPEPAEDGYEQTETVQFTAAVLEIRDNSILVEPLEGEQLRRSYDQIVVVTRNLELPELAVGDEIRVAYDGWIAESDPAVISGASAIELLEE